MSAITYNCVRLCGRRLSVLRGAASTAICSRHTLFQPPRAPSRWLGTSPYLTTDLAEAEVNARGSGYKEIAVTQEGTVLTILLNRPKTFNAYNYHVSQLCNIAKSAKLVSLQCINFEPLEYWYCHDFD